MPGAQPEPDVALEVEPGVPRGSPLDRTELFESINDLEEVDSDFNSAVAAVAPSETPVLEQSLSPLDEKQNAAGEDFKRTCFGARDTSCRAFSFLEIFVSSGRCTGSASADCKVGVQNYTPQNTLQGDSTV